MKLLTQPNRWTCLPTSIAMCLEVTLKDVVTQTGHDGSEILWPEMAEPNCRRSFHIEEMQYVAFHFGFHLIPYIGHLEYGPLASSQTVLYDWSGKLEAAFNTFSGVVLGNYVGSKNRHAVAWNQTESRLYDPSGHYASLETFVVQAFHAVTCRHRGVT